MNHNPNRHQAGTPEGGRFAAGARAESSVSLLAAAAPQDEQSSAQVIGTLMSGDGSWQAWEAAETRLCEMYPQVGPRILTEDFMRPMAQAALDGSPERLAQLAEDLERYAERESRWRAHESFIPPYTQDLAPEYALYPDRVGSKHTGWRPVADVAKDVRADLKEAVGAGYLPPEATFSVVTHTFTGGQSLRVEVRGLDDQTLFAPDSMVTSAQTYTERTALMRARVQAIATAYDRDRSDSQMDFFHNTYFCSTQVEDEAGAARRVALASARRAAGRRRGA